MKKIEVDHIEVKWNGPHTYESLRKCKEGKENGLYQIYGSHDIHGSDVLLYIGQTTDQTLGIRIAKHENEWMKWEPNTMRFYLGIVQGATDMNEEINITERLLLYYCSPPYNSHNLVSYGEIKATIITNIGRKHRLPYCVSTLVNDSDYWD